MDLKITRRSLGILAVGAAIRSSTGNPDSALDAIDKANNLLEDQPDLVVHRFMNADILELLMTYNNFYPNFRNTFGARGIEELDAGIKRLPRGAAINMHRLDALPASYAAHLLSTNTDGIAREKLEHRISDCLRRFPLSREIVLQNLIAATVPTTDSAARAPISRILLKDVEYVIDDAMSTHGMQHNVCIAIQYLLNARTLLKRFDAGSSLIPEIDRIASKVEESRNPEIIEVRSVMSEHGRLFRDASIRNHLSVSPNVTEIIFGYGGFPAHWRNYAESLTGVNARMFYNHWRVFAGEAYADGASQIHAKNAVARNIQIWRNRRLYSMANVQLWSDRYIYEDQKDFMKFLKMLPDILNKAETVYGIDVAKIVPANTDLTYTARPNEFPLGRFRPEYAVGLSLTKEDIVDLGVAAAAAGAAAGGIDATLNLRNRLSKYLHEKYKKNDASNAEEILNKIEIASENAKDNLAEKDRKLGPVDVYAKNIQ